VTKLSWSQFYGRSDGLLTGSPKQRPL